MRERVAAAFSPRRGPASAGVALVAALLAAITAAGCVADGDNSIARTARVRRVGELRAEREVLQRELAVLQQTDGQLEREIAAARTSTVQAGAQQRVAAAVLAVEKGRVDRIEAELAAARARAVALEAELAPLRALAAEAAQQEELATALRNRLAARQAEVATLEALVAQQEADLTARYQAAQQRLVVGQQFATAIADVERALAEALAKLPPPPPAAPATAPAAAAPAAPAAAPAAPPAAAGKR